jgi:methylenetetrahydrofolate dehydrogenase (NADP+)/methenyltetrahydrofolate cyclohydrolase
VSSWRSIHAADWARQAIAQAGCQLRDQGVIAAWMASMAQSRIPASISHVRMKRNRCAEVGIESRHVPLPAQTTTEQVVRVIAELSNDPAVHGILQQHPVPWSHRRAGRL